RADDLAVFLDGLRGEPTATVLPPFARLFPLRGEVSSYLHAGSLPGDCLAVVTVNAEAFALATFDPQGNLASARNVPRPEVVTEAIGGGYERYNEAALAYLRDEIGFQPGLIHVKEFRAWNNISLQLHGGPGSAFAEAPDRLPADVGHTWVDRARAGRGLYSWMEDGNFVVSTGGALLWVGPTGQL